MIEIIIFFLVTLALTYISNKIKLLPNFSGEKHQLFINEKKDTTYRWDFTFINFKLYFL